MATKSKSKRSKTKSKSKSGRASRPADRRKPVSRRAVSKSRPDRAKPPRTPVKSRLNDTRPADRRSGGSRSGSTNRRFDPRLGAVAREHAHRLSCALIIDFLEATGQPAALEDVQRVVDSLPPNIEFVDDAELEDDVASGKHAAKASFTPRSSLAIYFRELAKIPLLKREEEISLAKQIEESKKGWERLRRKEKIRPEVFKKLVTQVDHKDQRQYLAEQQIQTIRKDKRERVVRDLNKLIKKYADAKEKMIKSNLRLVISIAKRYQNLGLPLSDLINEGNLGLIKSVDKFDYHRGFRFSTYSTWYIRQAISRALTDKSRTIRLPAHIAESMNRFLRVRSKLSNDLGREPLPAEIAKALGLKVDRVMEMMRVSQDTASLDMPIGQEQDTLLSEILEDERPDAYFRKMNISFLYDELKRMLETLSERERKIIQMRFGLDAATPRTLNEIGQELGLTRERIRQIEERTLEKLKKLCIRRNVYEFLTEVGKG